MRRATSPAPESLVKEENLVIEGQFSVLIRAKLIALVGESVLYG